MGFRDAFLVSVLILLVAVVTAEKSTRASSPVVAHRGRLLRKVDADEANALHTEERGVKSWVKMQHWLAAGKSDDEVKKALQMEGLTGAALTAHPNYEKLQKFLFMRKSREVNGWLKQEEQPKSVWNYFGLEKMTADQRTNSAELKRYMRYAKQYDGYAWGYWKKLNMLVNYGGGSPAEMSKRVELWAKAKRPNSFVKDMLRIERASDPDYKYYLQFLQLTGRSE